MDSSAKFLPLVPEVTSVPSSPLFAGAGRVMLAVKRATASYPSLTREALAFLVLSIVFLCRSAPLLLGPYSISAWPDATHWLQPLFCAIDRIAATGERPYWLETLSGVREYTDPQFSITYPFYFFGSGWYATPVGAALTLHRIAFLHLFILYVNIYVMLRVFGVRWIPAVVGATVAAFCTNTYAYMGWIQIIAPYSWLPLALAGIYLILEDRRPLAGFVLGVIAIPLLVLASPAHPLIHLVYVAAVLAVFATVAKLRAGAALYRPWRNLAVLGIVSFVLAAPGLIPPLLELKNCIRWVGVETAVPIVGNAPIPYEHFSIGEAPARDLAHIFFAYPLQQYVGDSFIGVLPVFLACFSIFALRRNWIVAALLMLGIYALLSSTGTHLGFSALNYHLPLLNKSREPARHLFVWILACGALAAFGFEHLTELARRSKLWFPRPAHLLVLGLFVVALYSAYRVRGERPCEVSSGIAFGSLAVFAVGLLAANRFSVVYAMAWQAALAVIVIAAHLVLPLHAAKLLPGTSIANLPLIQQTTFPGMTDLYWDPNPRAHRVLERLAQFDDVRDFRVLYQPTNFSPPWWGMNGCFYGLRSFHNYINPQNYPLLLDSQLTYASNRVARLWGGKYFIGPASESAPPPGYTVVEETAGFTLYKNPEACPRCYLANRIAGAYDSRDSFVAAVNAGGDLTTGAYVPDAAAGRLESWLAAGKAQPPGRVTPLARTANQASYLAESDAPSLCVFNEFLHRDWKVELDDQRVDVVPVNWNRMGVLLPPGKHVITFAYRPRLFGWLVSLQHGLVLVLMPGVALMALGQRGRKPGQVFAAPDGHGTLALSA